MCSAGVSLTPGDSLAGNQSLHIHRPQPPASLSPQAAQANRTLLSPAPCLCVCLFSMQNVVPIGEGDLVDVPQDSESQLREQEKRIEISCALATEASRRGRMLSGERGWASLRQGDQLTRCRGGSAVPPGARNREKQGQADVPHGQGEHLLSTRYSAGLGGCKGATVADIQESEP